MMAKEYSLDDGAAIDAAMDFEMPWGKYKGRTMERVPDGYLRWLSEECDNDTIASYADLLRRYREKWNKTVEE